MNTSQRKTPLYHGTCYFNRYYVSREGLLTDCDRRKKGRVWLAEERQIPDVLRHITQEQHMNACWYAVFQIDTDKLPNVLRGCGRPGIYYTTDDIHPQYVNFCGVVYILIDQGVEGVVAC